jgi:hypothetical protein
MERALTPRQGRRLLLGQKHATHFLSAETKGLTSNNIFAHLDSHDCTTAPRHVPYVI